MCWRKLLKLKTKNKIKFEMYLNNIQGKEYATNIVEEDDFFLLSIHTLKHICVSTEREREGEGTSNTGNVPVLSCKFSSLFLDVPKSSKVY